MCSIAWGSGVGPSKGPTDEPCVMHVREHAPANQRLQDCLQGLGSYSRSIDGRFKSTKA